MENKTRPLVPINQNGLDEVADALLNSPAVEEGEEGASRQLIVPSSINPSEYLQIPNSNILIARYEPDWTKGFDYENAHKTVLGRGLFVPTPGFFMHHFLNVVNAYNGRSVLYDGNSNKVEGKDLEDIYFHLTKDRINGGAWTWLNGKFVQGSGFNGFDLEHITGIDANGNLITKREKLEPYLTEETYVNLDFNSQGLPKSKSQGQNYVQGQNIKFWVPVEGRVARFGANSGRTDLFCDRGPSGSDASLGVYACAEGVQKGEGETK